MSADAVWRYVGVTEADVRSIEYRFDVDRYVLRTWNRRCFVIDAEKLSRK